ncbi:hypothetical protein Tco_0037698 [Tanacetum coccineum]
MSMHQPAPNPDSSALVVENVAPEDGEIDTDILLTIKDDILREKLLNINLLIAKIEALNANPTPSSDFVLKSPIPVEDGDSFLEKIETTPELETFKFDIEEKKWQYHYFKSELFYSDLNVRILQKSQENGQNRINTDMRRIKCTRAGSFPSKGKFKRFSFYETPKVVSLAWETISEIKHAFEDKQYQPEGILELFRKLHDDVQNIHEELAEYINTLSWNRPTIYSDDDDEDYTIAITPDLSITDSLIMEDEHLDTIPAT